MGKNDLWIAPICEAAAALAVRPNRPAPAFTAAAREWYKWVDLPILPAGVRCLAAVESPGVL